MSKSIHLPKGFTPVERRYPVGGRPSVSSPTLSLSRHRIAFLGMEDIVRNKYVYFAVDKDSASPRFGEIRMLFFSTKQHGTYKISSSKSSLYITASRLAKDLGATGKLCHYVVTKVKGSKDWYRAVMA